MFPSARAATVALLLASLSTIESHVIDTREVSLVAKREFQLEGRAANPGCCGCGLFSSPAPIGGAQQDAAFLQASGGASSGGSSSDPPARGSIRCGTHADGSPNLLVCKGGAGVYFATPTGAVIVADCGLVGSYASSIAVSCDNGQTAQGQICDTAGFCVIVAGC